MININIKKQYQQTTGLIQRFINILLLPKPDYMRSISEVIILNNDQHEHKKTATTNYRIKSKIKQQHTTFVDWCYCL